MLIDRDLPLKKTISENIKRLMKERGWTQLKTSEMSGISKSTLSDYINCKCRSSYHFRRSIREGTENHREKKNRSPTFSDK